MTKVSNVRQQSSLFNPLSNPSGPSCSASSASTSGPDLACADNPYAPIPGASEVKRPTDVAPNATTAGLIDSHRFSLDCVTRTFAILHPSSQVFPFASVGDCITQQPTNLDVLIWTAHGGDSCHPDFLRYVAQLRQAFPTVPLVVFLDAESERDPETIRGIMKAGAQGVVSTRTSSPETAIAAVQLVKAGGTFAPLDSLLNGRTDDATRGQEPTPGNHLTSRQVEVLRELRQGKANKIIAYELGMSESTVKVHVRNIMRKVRATNRTEAVYKAQRFVQNSTITARAEYSPL